MRLGAIKLPLWNWPSLHYLALGGCSTTVAQSRCDPHILSQQHIHGCHRRVWQEYLASPPRSRKIHTKGPNKTKRNETKRNETTKTWNSEISHFVRARALGDYQRPVFQATAAVANKAPVMCERSVLVWTTSLVYRCRYGTERSCCAMHVIPTSR